MEYDTESDDNGYARIAREMEEEEEEFFLLLCLFEIQHAQGSRSFLYNRINWDRHVTKLLHVKLFIKTYRMSYASFLKLVSILEPHLHFVKGNSRVNNHVFPEMMVALTLRYLAGGSILDLINVYGLNRAWAYRVRDKVIGAILTCKELQIRFPIEDTEEDHAERNKIRIGFMSKSDQSIFHQCHGALDGMLQPCKCPSKKDSNGNQDGYWSGHYCTYGLNCQALCDAHLRFTFFSVAAPGGCHDAEAIKKTKFQAIIDSLGEMHYIVSDAAYPLTNEMLIPFSGPQRDTRENDVFNFYLSQIRIRIEMSFGRLVGKWCVLRSPLLQNSVLGASKVILACAFLHNFVINHDCDTTIDPITLSNDFHEINPLQCGNELTNHLGYLPTVEPFTNVTGTSEVRNIIVSIIKSMQLRRPTYNVQRRAEQDNIDEE